MAAGHAKRAVQRLAALMECKGRQSQVAVAACKAILATAAGTGGPEDLAKLSDEQLMARLQKQS